MAHTKLRPDERHVPGRDHDGLLNDFPPLPMRAGAVDPIDRTETETSVQLFFATTTLDDVLLAANVVRKLGFVPEIRLQEDASGYGALELYVQDLPSMARVLRESIKGPRLIAREIREWKESEADERSLEEPDRLRGNCPCGQMTADSCAGECGWVRAQDHDGLFV